MSFVETAQLVVSEELAASGHSSMRIDAITKYLAAHYLAVTDELGNLTEVTVGDSTMRVDNGTRDSVGKGLALTRYGQQAMALDTTGVLAAKMSGDATNFGFKARFRTV